MPRPPQVSFGAEQKTFLLSCALTLAAVTLSLRANTLPIVVLGQPQIGVGVALAGLFFLAEQFLLNVEFRRQAHSLTLAGVPLAIGVLVAESHTILLARVIGSALALVMQRVSWDKLFYNLAAYAFEASVAVTIVHLLLGSRTQLGVSAAAVMIGVIAVGDQVMSLLVLCVIRMHNGDLSRRDVWNVLSPAAVLSVIASAFACVVVLLLDVGALGNMLAVFLVVVLAWSYRGYLATSRRHQALALVHDFVSDGVGARDVESLSQHLLVRIRQLLRAASAELILSDSPPSDDRGPAVSGQLVGTTIFTVAEDDQRPRQSPTPGPFGLGQHLGPQPARTHPGLPNHEKPGPARMAQRPRLARHYRRTPDHFHRGPSGH